MEQYPGGAAAVARHISGFCKSVTLLSMLGENGEYKNYIKNSLPKNINTEFIYKKDSPTIVKKKYVDPYLGNLFGHKRGRHKSSRRADTAVLHRISTRIQWDQSRTPKPPKIK